LTIAFQIALRSAPNNRAAKTVPDIEYSVRCSVV